MTVAIGIGNKMEASEAAKLFSCSYSHIVNLCNSRKFKTAQKLEGRWMIDADEIYKAKNSGMIKPRKKRDVSGKPQEGVVQTEAKVTLQFQVEKSKFDTINLALSVAGGEKTLAKYVSDKIEELYTKIQSSFKSMEL